MTRTAKALRTTADVLRRDLEALLALEDEKRALDFDDPRLHELAHQVEEIAARVLQVSTEQTELTEVVAAEGAPGSIDTTRRPIAEILADWRDLERRAERAEPGSAEAAEVAALLRQVRAEYRAAQRSVEG